MPPPKTTVPSRPSKKKNNTAPSRPVPSKKKKATPSRLGEKKQPPRPALEKKNPPRPAMNRKNTAPRVETGNKYHRLSLGHRRYQLPGRKELLRSLCSPRRPTKQPGKAHKVEMMMLLKLNQQLIPGLADVLQQVADLKDATAAGNVVSLS